MIASTITTLSSLPVAAVMCGNGIIVEILQKVIKKNEHINRLKIITIQMSRACQMNVTCAESDNSENKSIQIKLLKKTNTTSTAMIRENFLLDQTKNVKQCYQTLSQHSKACK